MIRRIPVNGRLDQQRYKYASWSPNPLLSFTLMYEECLTELARRYFSWIGPATLAEFQWFSGVSQKTCRAAVQPLGLVPIEPDSTHFMLLQDLDQFKAFKAPKEPQYKLVSSLDGLNQLRRDIISLHDPEDIERVVPVEGGVRPLGGLSDLPSHAILDRGRVIRLWEFDVATSKIVWVSFIPSNAALKKAVADTEAYVRDQVGDARSFSLDSPKSREPKIAALRAASSL